MDVFLEMVVKNVRNALRCGTGRIACILSLGSIFFYRKKILLHPFSEAKHRHVKPTKPGKENQIVFQYVQQKVRENEVNVSTVLCPLLNTVYLNFSPGSR